jgi:late competence protein required for DNA uptake (superfamily II DNA/RNA helicase)
MYRVRLNTDMQECVCEIGRCGQTNAGEFERKPVSTFECTGCAFKRRVQSKFFIFFFTKIIYNQHTYLHNENIYKHKHTSIPPPNLKRHIAHNVAELTNLRDGSIQV